MHFYYETKEHNLEITKKTSVHVPPHLHRSLECIYVTEGSLELGIGDELYHMNTHDFGIVFPDTIHHYQVFDSQKSQAVYLLSAPSLTGAFIEDLQNLSPLYPVIQAENVHPDIPGALFNLLEINHAPYTEVLHQAFTQIILARSIPHFQLVLRNQLTKQDIILDTISYMAKHYMEAISLTRMAKDLGYSPYSLSRVFSSTFHTNFNQYLNELRLGRAIDLLENTSETVTEIAWNSGFTSLRTFNRVFKDRFRLSPKEYRNKKSPSLS